VRNDFWASRNSKFRNNTGGAKAGHPGQLAGLPREQQRREGREEVRTQGRRPVRGGRRRGREATGERRWGEPPTTPPSLGLPLRRWTPPRGSRRRAEDQILAMSVGAALQGAGAWV